MISVKDEQHPIPKVTISTSMGIGLAGQSRRRERGGISIYPNRRLADGPPTVSSGQQHNGPAWFGPVLLIFVARCVMHPFNSA